jgi:NAD(P)-dependent dehydrogenase (short-subunit alcohol dehydrogenase family)
MELELSGKTAVVTGGSPIERQGTIVNVSSNGARLAGSGPFDYNVSKAALNALTKVIAEQFGAEGVRAITVSPGPSRPACVPTRTAPSGGWPSRTASSTRRSPTSC